MENNLIHEKETVSAQVISAEELLNHWQGHRKLTRRVIEAFPEKELFDFSVGGMRPFAQLAMEMIEMSGPGVRGVASGVWKSFGDLEDLSVNKKPTTKAELLQLWDVVTDEIDKYWSQIPPGRFQEEDVAFGQYKGPVYWTLFYFIDNEIHHRGQGYVYLRALGIEPPAFWDR